MLEARKVEVMRLIKLMSELIVHTDRSLDDLGEERHEQQELERIALRLDLLAVNVHDVAHALEGVERDTQRQEELERRSREVDAERAEDVVERAGEEVVILQKREDTEVEDQAERHDPALLYLKAILERLLLLAVPVALSLLQKRLAVVVHLLYPYAEQQRADGCEQDERCVLVARKAIEYRAGCEQDRPSVFLPREDEIY